jgi:hypothetical protein
MSDQSNFKDEDIREHLRQTRSKRVNVDHDRARLMRELKVLAEQGREEEFEAKLIDAGIVRNSKQWRDAKFAFQAFRQSR